MNVTSDPLIITPSKNHSHCLKLNTFTVYSRSPSFRDLNLMILTTGSDYKCMLSRFSCVWLFVTQRTLAHQAPLSTGFCRQEYWNGLPCPSPGDLPDPGIKPASPEPPALAGGVLDHYRHLGTYKCLWHIVICHFLEPFIERSKSFPSLPYPPNSLQLTHELSSQMLIPSLGGDFPNFSIHHHSCFKTQRI